MNSLSPYFAVRMASVMLEQFDVLNVAPELLTVLIAALKEIDEHESSVPFKVGPSSFSKLFAYSQLLSAVCAAGGLDTLGMIELIDTANQEVNKLRGRYQGKDLVCLDLLAKTFNTFLSGETVEGLYKVSIERVNGASRT